MGGTGGGGGGGGGGRKERKKREEELGKEGCDTAKVCIILRQRKTLCVRHNDKCNVIFYMTAADTFTFFQTSFMVLLCLIK